MEISDMMVILESRGGKLIASARVVDMNIDRSKIQLLVEESATMDWNFRMGERCWFELVENDDGTYEAMYLRRIPGTVDGVIPQLSPKFIIGGAIPVEGVGMSPEEQATLF